MIERTDNEDDYNINDCDPIDECEVYKSWRDIDDETVFTITNERDKCEK